MKKLQKLVLSIISAFSIICMVPQSLVVTNVFADDGTNIAKSGTAYAETTLITAGDKTFLNDDNINTVWSAETSTSYAGVKLDKKYSVNKVRIVFENLGDETTKLLGFTVSYYDSTNGTYANLYTDTSYDENNDVTSVGHKYFSEYSLTTPIITNEIKVTITTNTTTENAKIADIQAYGEEYDESKIPTNIALGKSATATYVDWGACCWKCCRWKFRYLLGWR